MSNKSKKEKYLNRGKSSQKKSATPRIILISLIAATGLLLFVVSTPGQFLIHGIFNPPQEISSVTSGRTSLNNNSGNQISIPKEEPLAFNANLTDDLTEDLKAGNEPILIKVSELTQKMKFFTSRSANNAEISFFAALGTDGKPRVAFDACDVCYRSKKGYSQSGELAVCNNCGNRYPIDALGTENLYGGCWPSYLEADIRGDNILIDPSTIENKEYMFL